MTDLGATITSFEFPAFSSSLKSEVISSSNFGSVSYQAACPNVLPRFGINIDLFPHMVLPYEFTEQDNLKVENAVEKVFTPFLIDHYTELITNRNAQTKVGENYTCAGVNTQLFLNRFFADLVVKQENEEHQILRSGADVTHHSLEESKGHFETDFGTNDPEKTFNILLYLSTSILEDSLKPDLFTELKNSIPNFKTHFQDASFVEMFRGEAMEAKEDFFKDFFKLLWMAVYQCIVLMNALYKKTGKIYPIMAPSFANAGDFFRLSLTSILPPPILHFLSQEVVRKPSTLCVADIIQHLEKDLASEKRKENDAKCKTSASDNDSKKTRAEILQNKVEILKSFFPEFLREDLAISHSTFGYANGRIEHPKTCVSAKGIVVKKSESLKRLMYCCFSMTQYILMMTKRVLCELEMVKPEDIYCKKLGDFSMNGVGEHYLDYRFENIKKGDNKERSSIFVVERYDHSHHSWEKNFVIKSFKGNQSESFSHEQRFNTTVIKTIEDNLIMEYKEPCTEFYVQSKMIIFLYSTAKVLNSQFHSKGYVHGDIKPEHLICDRFGRVDIIDCEFVTSHGSQVVGCTFGYHPPEYENESIGKLYSSVYADVYSLALSVLTKLHSVSPLEVRRCLDKYVGMVENETLKRVLELMLNQNPEERILLGKAMDMLRNHPLVSEYISNSMQIDH